MTDYTMELTPPPVPQIVIDGVPQGPQGDKGDTGDSGVATATAPLHYDAPSKTVSVAVGTTAGTVAAGDDARFDAGGAVAGVFNVRDYGATGDGATDDTTAIQAATTAATATGAGGVILFPPGIYAMSGTLNFDECANVTLQGYGSRMDSFAGTAIPNRTEIRYTGTGTGTFISAKSALGFAIDGVSVRYTDAGFTGTLIALSIGVRACYKAAISNCFIGGTLTAHAATLMDLDGTVDAVFTNVNFAAAALGVSGRGASGYSNAVTFFGCRFVGLTVTASNPYAQWTFDGCTFETATLGVASGVVSPIVSTDDAHPISGLTFSGCGWWDCNGGGPWIDVRGNGLSIHGGYWEPQGGTGEQLIRVTTTATRPTFEGLSVVGLRAEGMSGSTGSALLKWTNSDTSQTLTNVHLAGNSLTNAVTGLSSLTGSVAFTGTPAAMSLTVLGDVTTAVTLANTAAQTVRLTAPTCAVTLPKVAAGVRVKTELSIVQDSTGGRLATWPSTVRWAGGSTPTLASGANTSDVVRLHTDDGGVSWVGALVGMGISAASVPNAVGTVTAAPNNTVVTLTWTAPPNGGSTIIDYTTQYRTTAGPGSWTTYTHAPSSTPAASVGSLTNGTSYDFRVAAVNAIGTGPWSAVISSTPVSGSAVPGPLTTFTAGAPATSYPFDLSTNNKITVVFSAQFSTWSADGYLMEHTANTNLTSGWYIDDFTSGTLKVVMSQLSPGTTYSVWTFPRPSVGGVHKLAVTFDRSGTGGVCTAAVDGTVQTLTQTNSTLIGGTNFSNDTVYMASRANTTFKWTGGVSSPPLVLTHIAASPELITLTT